MIAKNMAREAPSTECQHVVSCSPKRDRSIATRIRYLMPALVNTFIGDTVRSITVNLVVASGQSVAPHARRENLSDQTYFSLGKEPLWFP